MSTPIADLVKLARRYSCEEWELASRRALNEHVSEACKHLADLRRNDVRP